MNNFYTSQYNIDKTVIKKFLVKNVSRHHPNEAVKLETKQNANS